MTIPGKIYAGLKEHKDGKKAMEELMAIPIKSTKAHKNRADLTTERTELQLCTNTWGERASKVRELCYADPENRNPQYSAGLLDIMNRLPEDSKDHAAVYELLGAGLKEQERKRRFLVLQDEEAGRELKKLRPLQDWFYDFRMDADIAGQGRAAQEIRATEAGTDAPILGLETVHKSHKCACHCIVSLPERVADLTERRAEKWEWYALIFETMSAIMLVTGRRPCEILDPRGQTTLKPVPEKPYHLTVTGLYKKPRGQYCMEGHQEYTIPVLERAERVIEAIQILRSATLPGSDKVILREGQDAVRMRHSERLLGIRTYGQLRGVYTHLAHAMRGDLQFMPQENVDIAVFAKACLGHDSLHTSQAYRRIQIRGLNNTRLNL